ncbi:MAG: hypothetical protein AAGK21_01605 [Bacteroidota bacterium]
MPATLTAPPIAPPLALPSVAPVAPKAAAAMTQATAPRVQESAAQASVASGTGLDPALVPVWHLDEPVERGVTDIVLLGTMLFSILCVLSVAIATAL